MNFESWINFPPPRTPRKPIGSRRGPLLASNIHIYAYMYVKGGEKLIFF